MKYDVEVISMQVDNIVTTHLHHGTCIALQNTHVHEGKKVPKCGLKSSIFSSIAWINVGSFSKSIGSRILIGSRTTGDPSQATNTTQYVSWCRILVTTLSRHFHSEIGQICSILNLPRNKIWPIWASCRCQVAPAWVVATCLHLIRPWVAYKFPTRHL